MAYMGERAVGGGGPARPIQAGARALQARTAPGKGQGDHSMGGGRALKIRGVHKKRAGFAMPATPLNLPPETQTAPQGRRAQPVLELRRPWPLLRPANRSRPAPTARPAPSARRPC